MMELFEEQLSNLLLSYGKEHLGDSARYLLCSKEERKQRRF